MEKIYKKDEEWLSRTGREWVAPSDPFIRAQVEYHKSMNHYIEQEWEYNRKNDRNPNRLIAFENSVKDDLEIIRTLGPLLYGHQFNSSSN